MKLAKIIEKLKEEYFADGEVPQTKKEKYHFLCEYFGEKCSNNDSKKHYHKLKRRFKKIVEKELK